MAIGIALLGMIACGGNDASPPAPPADSRTPDGRTIADSAKAAMRDALGAATTGKKAWFLSQPGNTEVAALVASLTGVFKEAGWEVSAEPAVGVSLKAGVMTLVGEEQYPPYVDVALKAMDASGLGAKSAAGYRAYYDEKKKENANWPGIPMKPDQDFVIVVGPKPAA